MKTLLLIRHAKSSWETDRTDFDRPLNERGKKDAPAMAARIWKRKARIDVFITSPAKRAASTAGFFAEKWGLHKDALQLVPALYNAGPAAFSSTVAQIDDRYETAAIFAHNPGITEFANSLGNARIDDMPTCAVFAVQCDTPHWSGFPETGKVFLFFDYPKMAGS